jgi:hypothetical protein
MHTTTPPDDEFDNALAVFHHDVRAVLPEFVCQFLVDEIREVHESDPSFSFADCVEIARTALQT